MKLRRASHRPVEHGGADASWSLVLPQHTYLYSRLTPAKTIVTCVHKKTSLEFMELLVSADATTISKRKCFFFFNFLQGVEKSSKGIIKADKERKAAKTFEIMTFFLIYALFLILRKSDA